MSSDSAIIGFGFGGLMVLANLIRQATTPQRVDVIGSDLRGFGVAYGTANPQHLLNVPARNMSAFAEQPGHFVQWLATADAARAAQQLNLPALPDADDYAPRALYAQYLANIHRQLVADATEKQIAIAWHHQEATAAEPTSDGWALTLADGKRIATRQLVLATGHEVKPVFPGTHHPALLQNPWLLSADRVASFGHGPVVIIGTGLTTVDTLISLRTLGYRGAVVAIARNGLLPQPHRAGLEPITLAAAELPKGGVLSALRWLRHTVRRAMHDGTDWRQLVDALRPHTSLLWHGFPARDQQRFLRRLATFWNIHRHRMAPEIAARVQQEITAGSLRIVAACHMHLHAEREPMALALQRRDGEAETLHPTAIINCTGPELDWAKSKQPLLQQLLQQNAVARHATGIGVLADAQCRIGRQLYAMGGLMTGQFLESTAVPELRQQAATIGEQLCRT